MKKPIRYFCISFLIFTLWPANSIFSSDFSIELSLSGGLSKIKEQNVTTHIVTYNENRTIPYNLTASIALGYEVNTDTKILFSLGGSSLTVGAIEKNMSFSGSKIRSSGTVNAYSMYWGAPDTGDYKDFILQSALLSYFRLAGSIFSNFWVGTGVHFNTTIKSQKYFSDNPEFIYRRYTFSSQLIRNLANFGLIWSLMYFMPLTEKMNLVFKNDNLYYFNAIGRKGSYQDSANSFATAEHDMRSIDFNLSIGLEYKL